jgi:uncharacterized membrane protein
MSRPAPRSIDQYLEQLRDALRGEDPALVQDALYDAEEYLRAEVAQHAGKSEADVLEIIASTYGAPDEVADAYRTTEKTVRAALQPPAPKPNRTALGRLFGVYADSRTYTALFYMLLAFVTGCFYFVFTVTGIALSAGLAILIVGVPFFLLFIGGTRVLALVEGRIVEGLLGVRMPRRPIAKSPGGLFERIKDMLTDRRTWTTILYLALMLPLGLGYFIVTIVGTSLSLGLIAAAVMVVLRAIGFFQEITVQMWNGNDAPLISAPLLAIAGTLLLTALMHLVRGLGGVHGQIAKALLVAPAREATA